MTLTQGLCVFLGGGAGACFRWLTGALCLAIFPAFNFGVTVCNLAGCFAIGVAVAFFQRYCGVSPGVAIEWERLVVTGFLGGFTTFSSFSMEAVTLFERKETAYGILFVAGQVILCLVLTYAGYWWGRR